jgi:hypothetical protein
MPVEPNSPGWDGPNGKNQLGVKGLVAIRRRVGIWETVFGDLEGKRLHATKAEGCAACSTRRSP